MFFEQEKLVGFVLASKLNVKIIIIKLIFNESNVAVAMELDDRMEARRKKRGELFCRLLTSS